MDSDLLPARISDTISICERSGVPKFLGFLSEEEAAAASSILKKQLCKYCFYGGYEDAQRTVLACLPEWCDSADYPICSITFSYRKCDKLTHRDFLGSLMALGIVRESVGDILVEEGRAVVFLSTDVQKYVKSEITKIGRTGVVITEGHTEPLPGVGKLTAFSDTIASSRLDCVISSLIGASRKTACELITSQKVSINSVITEKGTKNVCNGDKITVRGKGKYIITSLDELSKKGRIKLKYEKYI